MLSLLLTSLILINLQLAHCQQCPPRKAMEAEICASKLFVVGNRAARMPQTISEVEKYCSTIRKAGKCLKNYANQCLQPLPKQISSVLNRAVENNSNKVCNTLEGREEFIKRISCINKNIHALHQCMEKYIDNLERIKRADSRDKIPMTCCYSSIFRSCMEKGIEGLCPPDSDAYIHELIISYAREVLETLCGQWTGPEAGERCSTLPPLPARDSRSPKSMTAYNPIMDIFANL